MKNFIATLVLSLATVAASAASTNLVDYKGRALPSNPAMTTDARGNPDYVTVQSKTFKLYPFGSGPELLATFNGLKRECLKLDANHTGCYATNPFETDIVEDNICGYPAVPAVILSCRAGGGCVSEIYVSACATSYPDTSTIQAYIAPTTTREFGGSLNEGGDFETQHFSSKFDFTGNLNTAELIVRQGRRPILGVGSMFMNFDWTMRPDAREILKRAIARYPTVFAVQDLAIEIADEPLMRATPAMVERQIDSINKSVALVRELLPTAKIGTVIAPTWDTDTYLLTALPRIMHNFDWIATDPYLLAFSEVSSVVLKALQFNTWMRNNYPRVKTYLVMQGFAPVYEKAPSQWGASEINTFTWFLGGIFNAAKSYDGTLIWGWSAVNELKDEFSGENFPQAIKDIYIGESKAQAQRAKLALGNGSK
jgi:hypothetical protein